MSKTVLITGTSSGIGKATVELFSQRGWNVVATLRNPEKTPDLVSLKGVTVLPLDVTDSANIQDIIKQVRDRFGTLDTVVNNAGYALVGAFEASTPAQIERQFATNVFGLMEVTRAVLPIFRTQGYGTIINIASVGGRITFPLYSLYHATKWAVEGFSESLHYELAPLGIRVKIVEPGPIKTDFYDRSQDLLSQPGLTAYDNFINRAMPKLQKSGFSGAPPELVAKVIYRAATDHNQRLRYSANSALLLTLRKILPDSLCFGIVRAVVS